MARWPAAGPSITCPNTEEGCAPLAQQWQKESVARIIVEATGGYEHPLVATLQAAGLPVILVNPRRSRAFAQAQGLRAQTDRIEATMLAQMGALLQRQPRTLPDEQTRQ